MKRAREFSMALYFHYTDVPPLGREMWVLGPVRTGIMHSAFRYVQGR